MAYRLHPGSDLPEVLQYSDLPERAIHDSPQLAQVETITAQSDSAPTRHYADGTDKYVVTGDGIAGPTSGRTPNRAPRTCGMPRWVFWTAMVVTALIIIGVAVGGGVGATLHTGANAEASAALTPTARFSATSVISGAPTISTATAETATSAAMVATTTSFMASITTTQVPLPQKTLLRDCPSSNNTLHSYGSLESPQLFRKFCNQVNYAIAGTDNVNGPTVSLNDCIDLCASYNDQNRTEIAGSSSPVCSAVCWRNGIVPGDDFPGQCFGWQTTNKSDGSFAWKAGDQNNCDGAALINQQVVLG
ncbi:hypothetical protein B0A48_10077 [Cryoendolithus antarcticus]|uniref:Apple domain-containing protein n=1 Tax=Cryoendolithus antarcticus TaxID=1507870 RepID=A0A1V8T3Z2_9PEZI|nr:hypothetical protein B0A48_10077 [Cryoendolithus antarcticus]